MDARRTAPPPLIGWPPHLTADDVLWLPFEGRWVGRTSKHLPKRERQAADKAAEFERNRPEAQA
jgi:hypothetical protein